MNQKQATINAIISVLKERGVDYELNGETLMSEVITKEDRDKVKEILFAGFRSGDIEYRESFKEKVQDDDKLNSYIPGLINNWVRKAKEFNNGNTYKAKNPGSRAGSQDPEVKALKALLSTQEEGSENHTKVKAALDTKLAEIKAEKNKVEIDASLLPESLRHLV